MALGFECENCRDTSIDTLYEGRVLNEQRRTNK